MINIKIDTVFESNCDDKSKLFSTILKIHDRSA